MRTIVFALAFIALANLGLAQAQQTTPRTAFNSMLSSYFDMKNGLATESVVRTGAGARSLLRALKSFPLQSIPEQYQAEWSEQTIQLKKDTEPMLTDKELKTLRKNFESVSKIMINLVSTLKYNNQKVYVEYCPMIRKSWLNESDEIQNPFFGSKMYDCGEITSVISKR